MSLAQIRKQYGVPAFRGARVRYVDVSGEHRGTIVGSSRGGLYLRIRLDGERLPLNYHPTWNLTYLPKEPTP